MGRFRPRLFDRRTEMKLTLDYIKRAIKNDPRFDRNIDEADDGVIGVWTNEGWTWDAMDDRHVEFFHLTASAWSEYKPDTVEYWNKMVSRIEAE